LDKQRRKLRPRARTSEDKTGISEDEKQGNELGQAEMKAGTSEDENQDKRRRKPQTKSTSSDKQRRKPDRKPKEGGTQQAVNS